MEEKVQHPCPLLGAWDPPTNVFKINFDNAIRDKFSMQAAMCHDCFGQIIQAQSCIGPPCDPNIGEALAALLAAQMEASLNLQSYI